MFSLITTSSTVVQTQLSPSTAGSVSPATTIPTTTYSTPPAVIKSKIPSIHQHLNSIEPQEFSESRLEFLINVAAASKLRIVFAPDERERSFAFVNAIEAFLAPPDFVRDSPPHVTRRGSDGTYNGVLYFPLRVVHRINVGGENVTPENDTMMRYWIPDDAYLLLNSTAIDKAYDSEIKYGERATKFDAPDSVYNTAKVYGGRPSNNFSISWRFGVGKGAQHLVRLHFCDIVSKTTNENFSFYLYIYGGFGTKVYPWSFISEPAAPFYMDIVVDSDDSGFMNISVGPHPQSMVKSAFLNGVEIMEMIRVLVDSNSIEKKLHLHSHMIIGWSVGVVVLVTLVLIVLIFCLRRNKWEASEASKWRLVPIRGGSSHSSKTSVTGSIHADLNLGLKVPLSLIHFATRKFSQKLMIGEGGFGKVYEGKLRNGAKVAVKRSEAGHGQGLEEFHTEIRVLSKIRHQHLVSLMGYCDERDEMILVYEFMEKGTLRDHLYTLEGESKTPVASPSPFSWDQRLRICIGAARGLDYLHTGCTETIVHRDIKSTNILLDENNVAKVADFGLSVTGSVDETHFTTQVKGSFGYLDPEYYTCLQLTPKSDVYSFGVVLLEVLCARPVVDRCLPKEQVNLADWGMSLQKKGQLESIVDPFLVGKINPDSLRIFGETVEKCLQDSGDDRPFMSEVLWRLEHCLQFQVSGGGGRLGQPHQDSTTGFSLGLPAHVVRRLPSNSMSVSEDEVALRYYNFSDESEVDVSSHVVFSQLGFGGAR
ncbi:probable receptor-like protein kinase At5g24010 [Salvia miltiorrhiza]|uniref:probable receptor-like protein kinase At5g24010 n=1 Tax=Salvia miltiorrhiza TaxID=226208 RepID=UPI0025AD2671|nr:probable receptor-like protein kinase At5g24010 [Salvia miltiorrhiza]